MFAVIYQGYTKPGQDEEFQEAWREVAQYFVEKRGAIGSCLHQTPEGLWVAYSRWPDRKTRDASWPQDETISDELPQEIGKAIATIKDCLDQSRKISEICMNVVDDLLISRQQALE